MHFFCSKRAIASATQLMNKGEFVFSVIPAIKAAFQLSDCVSPNQTCDARRASAELRSGVAHAGI